MRRESSLRALRVGSVVAIVCATLALGAITSSGGELPSAGRAPPALREAPLQRNGAPVGPQTTGVVEIQESGLPDGTSWWARMAGQNYSTIGSVIAFTVPYGTSAFAVGSLGYTAVPANGSVTVSEGLQTVPVAFHVTWPGPYQIRFAETGLPANTTWFVKLGSTGESTNGTDLLFTDLTAGTYSFEVERVGTFHGQPAGGDLTIGIRNVTQAVVFAVPPTVTNVTTPAWEWAVAVSAVGLWGVWVGYLAVDTLRERRRASGDPYQFRSGWRRSFWLGANVVLAVLWALILFSLVTSSSAALGPLEFGVLVLVFLGLSMANQIRGSGLT